MINRLQRLADLRYRTRPLTTTAGHDLDILLRFSIGILAALTVLSFAEFLSGTNPQAAVYAGIEGAALLVTAGLWRLNRQGRTWLSSNLLIVILLVFLTFGIEPAWLLSGPTLAAYVIPIAIAGLLFGPLAGFFICIAVTGLVILRAFTGILTDPALTFDPLQIALSLLALYFLATINWRSFRNLLQALDIAQRSAAEARALSGQLEEYASRLEESQRQLSRRAEYLEAAAQVTGVAAATLEQHQLLKHTADLISQRFNFYHTGIFLLDDRGECAVLHAASSAGGKRMMVRGHRLLVTQGGIVSSVAARGMPQILSDVQVDPTYTSNPDLPDTRSALALPLKAHGKIIGVLDVQSTQRDAFSNEDVTVLQTLADQVAMAISNARLFQQAQDNLNALSRVFGQISHEAWSELLRVQPDLGYRRDRRGISSVAASEKPTTGTAGTSSSPSTEKKNGAALVRPIRVREMVVGTINARKAQSTVEWTSAELNLLEALVGQLAVALEDARLYQETQRRAHYERITRQITEKVRANPNVRAISETAAKELAQALNATRGFAQLNLRVLDTEDTQEGDTVDPHDARHETQYFQYLSTAAAIDDSGPPPDTDKALKEGATTATSHDHSALLFSPLKLRGRTVGVLGIQDADMTRVWTAGEIALVETIADQVAQALEIAHLLDKTQRLARREQLVTEITGRIRSAPDLDGILRTTIQEIRRALGVSQGLIRLGTETQFHRSQSSLTSSQDHSIQNTETTPAAAPIESKSETKEKEGSSDE